METKDVVLTDEMKKRLKGYLAFKVDASFKYVPKPYRQKNSDGEYYIPKDLWPVFTLKGLDGVEATLEEDNMEISYGEITEGKASDSKMKINSGKTKLNTLKKGLVNWKNLRTEDGKLVQCPDIKNDGVSDESLRVLSPGLIAELYNAITTQSILTEEELQGLE